MGTTVRSRLQFHLATLTICVLTSAALLGLNAIPRDPVGVRLMVYGTYVDEVYHVLRGWPFAYSAADVRRVPFLESRLLADECSENDFKPEPSRPDELRLDWALVHSPSLVRKDWFALPLALNLAICLAIVIGVGAACEAFLRTRRQRRGD